MKKFLSATAIFITIIMLSSIVCAAVTEKFEVVDNQVCNIKINDYCEFEKKMTSYDLEKRQVTLQLKITNDSVSNQPTGEVMLVLDNSDSMNDEVGGTTRGAMVFSSAKSLISKMLNNNNSLKVGIVRFSSSSDSSKYGTDADASLVSELSSDASALNNSIDNIQKDGSKTDLEAGLDLASKHFSSSTTNKYIIVLTDGVPNIALGAANDYYSEQVISKTKAKLQALASNFNVITMLTGINNPSMPAGTHDYTFEYVINNIFGTPQAPTAGKFYYIQDSQIEQTITDDIYKDLLPQSQSIKNIKIHDFFPKEIVENFDFAYVSQPTKGTISQSIDANNKIVWELDELASGESATVQYTLTMKKNYNENIVNQILDTNEKVDITYKDFDDTDKTKTSDETPKVRLTVLKGSDPTTVDKVIPKAGKVAIIFALVSLLGFAVLSGTGILKINNDIKKQN